MNFLFVALGGFFGSMLRFYISIKANKHMIGTWIANITGSFFLGVAIHFYIVGELSETLWLIIGVGFCGSYTTFSTFGSETLQLISEKKYGVALWYVTSSLAVSLFMVYLILVVM